MSDYRPNWTLTFDKATPPANSSSDILTKEALKEALEVGLEKVWKRKFAQPFQGESLVRFQKTKREYGKMATFRGWTGTTPLSRDADDIAFLTKGEGFTWTYRTFNYRQGIAIERTAIETDEIGYTKGGQADLVENFRRTVEYTIADVYNRALGAAGSPVLADDGMYLIDSARPNPNPDGGEWSNLEATSDLTEDALFAAVLNADKQVSEDGNLYPQEVKKLMINPSWRLNMWKLLSTANVLGSNHNDRSWAAGAFSMDDVIIYKYLTTSAIFYMLADPKSEDNELVLFKRVEPTVMTAYGAMPNPDVLYQRIRAAFGLGLGSPRKFIRGGLLAAAS